MSASVLTPGPGPGHRLVATLAYALAVHVVIVLGFNFQEAAPPPATPPPLEIVLLREPPVEPEPPERPDYLAQHHHRGSGQRAEPVPPETRAAGEVKAPERAAPAPVAPPVRPPARVAAPPPELTAERSAESAPPPRPEADAPAPPTPPSVTELLAGARDYARIAARDGPRDHAPASRQREKYVDASTREHHYAAYLDAWRQKVEAVGNLNYPAQARRQGLAGTLRMTVRVAADGSVTAVELRRSSGHAVLDQAARDIVALAAPFAPFPEEIRRETDVLVITRTWQFLDNRVLGR